MPVYEYVCKKGHTFDRVKSILCSDRVRSNDRCDKCKSTAKIVASHPAHPILVGAGFHCNEYGAPTK